MQMTTGLNSSIGAYLPSSPIYTGNSNGNQLFGAACYGLDSKSGKFTEIKRAIRVENARCLKFTV